MVIRWLMAACLVGGLGLPAGADEAPRRVLSMNLCTDQLAMLLAAPGQLVSVSHVARDPRASALADQAMAYPVNHGDAEEIYLARPDLVLADSFAKPGTVQLLRRLGRRVELFDAAQSFDELRRNLIRMGDLLGRQDQARAMVARFDADLAALGRPSANRPRAAMYAANGYSEGPDSLAGEIIDAAGFANLAETLGVGGGGTVPLEVLMLAAPDLVISGEPYPGASRSEEILRHPGLTALTARNPSRVMADRDWVCATPQVLRAVAALAAAREAM